jgi:hypothetical protein
MQRAAQAAGPTADSDSPAAALTWYAGSSSSRSQLGRAAPAPAAPAAGSAWPSSSAHSSPAHASGAVARAMSSPSARRSPLNMALQAAGAAAAGELGGACLPQDPAGQAHRREVVAESGT